MILLDTNVISEPMRPNPDERVGIWMNAQSLNTLYLSAVTVAELRAGVRLLPRGKRRKGFHDDLEGRLLPLFAGRILPFDLDSSAHYAALREKLCAVGRAIAPADGYIAAIAAAHGFAIATRDAIPFEAAGLQVINPWQA